MPGYLRPEPEQALLGSYFDPVNKLRVSEAQALIDTDFEYGMQISKWENIALTNNRPFSYPSSNSIPNISSINIAQNTRLVTVNTTSAHGLTAGSSITVQDTFLSIANGNFTIDSIPTATSFTYTARATNMSATLTSIFDLNKTALYLGTPFQNASIGLEPTSLTYLGRAVTVQTSVPHGLALGNEVAISGITTTGANPPNGSFSIATIVDASTFIYYVPTIPTGTLTKTNARVFVRPQAQFLHRPFDGGILFSANSSSNNQQAVRQTRRYFRYQSGKGIQISSGTVLKPNLALDALTASGNTITVQCKEQHNLQPGSSVKIIGAEEPGYNGDFSIIRVTSYNTFEVEAAVAPSVAKASGQYYVVVNQWYGCKNRIGIFDSQNGLFFEFDGTDLYCVRRSSTFVLSGKMTVTNGSNTVSQTNAAFPTNFSKQLVPGDFVVIRGQSYRVETIGSDTTMTVSPSYRGATSQYVQVAKTVDTRWRQDEWNLDTMDGLGPSGFDLDLTKMQMFYIDYSWYGAGFIRWGLRGIDGTVTYIHKIINNNINSEAYMRSGNLPGRYESNTLNDVTSITSSILKTSSTINVDDTSLFPPAGTVMIRSGGVYEFVNYSGKTPTSFTGLVREKTGVGVGGTSPNAIDLTIAAGSSNGTVSSVAGLQVGQRVISQAFPENSYISEITGNNIKFNTAALTANPTGLVFPPMSGGEPQAFTYSTTTPVSVELAYPTYSASISHWGTSVIMDGRYDDDKSLVFSFGQTTSTTIPRAAASFNKTATGTAGSRTLTVTDATNIVPGMVVSGPGIQDGTLVTRIVSTTVTLSLSITGAITAQTVAFSGGNTRALFSIRVAPSVDNGIAALFGQRDLINRMQLTLRDLAVTTKTQNANMLVTAILNGVPQSTTTWTNVVKNATNVTNSSLAQVADYAGNNIVVTGGEITGGFFVNGTSSVDLTRVRDLGNCILGGGGNTVETNVYPDGPDILSITVTNLSDTDITVLGRLGWTEAQA